MINTSVKMNQIGWMEKWIDKFRIAIILLIKFQTELLELNWSKREMFAWLLIFLKWIINSPGYKQVSLDSMMILNRCFFLCVCQNDLFSIKKVQCMVSIWMAYKLFNFECTSNWTRCFNLVFIAHHICMYMKHVYAPHSTSWNIRNMFITTHITKSSAVFVYEHRIHH